MFKISRLAAVYSQIQQSLNTANGISRYSSVLTFPVRNHFTHSGEGADIPIEKKAFGQPKPLTHPHLLKSDELTIGITAQEYKDRRTTLANTIGDDSAAVVPGYGLRYVSNGIFYPFHQSTNFLYLTGFNEPDAGCVIAIVNTSKNHTFTMFVQPADRDTEIWDGPRAGIQGSTTHFGADDAKKVDTFESYLIALDQSKCISTIYSDLPLTVSKPVSLIEGTHIKTLSASATHPLTNMIDRMRLKKSSAEIALMREAGRISGRSFVKAMKFTNPGVTEHQIMAVLEFQSRIQGASGLAYVPVVAGGQNALTLHYVQNQQLLKDGDLLLVDAGAEYGGYVSDITRTWPVNGKFSESQRNIYDIVLQTQKHLISKCCEASNITLDELQRETIVLFCEKLSKLFGRNIGFAEMNRLYPHHVGHWLGMDVHDTPTIRRTTKLTEGMVVTIEPGLYIPDSASYPESYRGIGIRIEDDVVVGGPSTGNSPIILSVEAPKEIVDIEAVMAGVV
ncbi:hypothetical protein BATDEDRAFT_19533 [Batrachochytrium dendrobatidis JAM81]|uniref:Aminopeptidase P N-terminal domain-containing protein n=1 Tax=Batrachochytrium dendrobatidis (strain JAM81 / FGSC 10211) TaxID=684364 RepID=F4P291_BATDJ|nr:aminopeptidase [Batrachochytrium dendrobatidis JAM81]EGF81074.1 hypothetical protein BATDEDRAFT_19533 [Batrachochytrium dendrobatidis JAM81]|eukprot:XP_006678389.1 hypothetical protein BATDEDRAFT_19533 [Batrachochytrium dendrobatidis JAM81]